MLFKMVHLEGIARGDITRAFRAWKRPTVKTGGTLTTAAGVLAIDAVDIVKLSDITNADALAAGFASRDALTDELTKRSTPEKKLYRIAFRLVGEDPRVALRNNTAWPDDAFAALQKRFAGMDERSKDGAWTTRILALVAHNPRTRAPELAERIGMDTKSFKDRVRKLKGHGLTESLQIGYRISPRGEAFLRKAGATVVAAETSTSTDFSALDALVDDAGIVLQAAAGPLPTLTYVIAGEPVTRSWWGHKDAQGMVDFFEHLAGRNDVLACRVCNGKKTFVHRRLWPHLLALSPRLDDDETAVIDEAQSARGAYRMTTTPIADWMPDDVWLAASTLSEEEALDALGWWIAPALSP